MTGRDHLPPQSIFPKPRPSDLITVPACDYCNNKRSGLDEEFKVSIGIQAGHGEEGERLFSNQTNRTLLHNRKLREELSSTVKEIELHSPEGLFLGTAQAVLLKSESYDIVVDRIIRGLHWHHSGLILGDMVDIKVRWYRELSPNLYEKTKNWPTGIIGNGQFIYKYLVSNKDPISAWVLQFFNCAWSGGTVMPKKNVKPAVASDRATPGR